ncbi:hypothetical protein ILUMI_07477 [Ignelater luminosus]|uniref:Sulfatase N-terminal domain-containing protein n=1 Tax=Ignelater luminosus TaxID=2038154 RepID=A0A8K0D9B2_IGNLU|nr:hypothetical protein ILUMI_07477 [Ignelater luminosus]
MGDLKILICVLIFSIKTVHSTKSKPHIVIIIADDLGWNDVGFHGSNQIPTPNMDALAYNGVILNRFYTLPQCTPSRAALLTGQYPMRYGYQGIPILAGENRFLPFQIPTLAKKLKELGYDTHLIGKWHLGQGYRNATPGAHGFDNHFGYWNGFMGYFNHEATGGNMVGLDMHHNDEPVWDTRGQYATDLITEKSEEVIKGHNESKPLFLIVSHLAVHTGKGGVDLEVKDIAENNKKFGYIQDERRRMYAGMTDELDKSVGDTIKALAEKRILDNTIIVFFSDNGAPTIGSALLDNTGSNWPLRGQKFTVFDGGVRTVAMIYSEQLQNKGTINNELIHITDLMPTLYYAAGGDVASLGKIDGINQWLTITKSEKSQRSEALINIDEARNVSALLTDGGRYKLINGSTVFSEVDGDFYGETGRDDSNPEYNTDDILHSSVNILLRGNLTQEKILNLRKQMELKSCRKSTIDHDSCRYNSVCLFDLFEDPCETTNIANKFPEVTERMKSKLEKYWSEVKVQRKGFLDPNANPVYYNNTWYPWLEDTRCHVGDLRTILLS